MPETEPNARLTAIKVRPSYSHLPDELLTQLIREAVGDFEAYTMRPDPGDAVDGLIVEMACRKANMLGTEGAGTAKEADIMRSWDYLSDDLRIRLDRYRKVFCP